MMMTRRAWAAAAVACLLASPLFAADPPAKPGLKRVLLVTHSGGFVHDSVGVAEDVLKKIGPDHGMTVTCWRFTGDPAKRTTVKQKGKPDREMSALEAYNANFRDRAGRPVEAENCGRINKNTLKNFDLVLFFTTGDPVTKAELKDLTDWVKAGGAFAGTHCATDTLYSQAAYGEMIGAYFKGHPSGLQDFRFHVEDPKHPAAAAFADEKPYKDEMYIFKDAPYSRDKLHLILSARGLNPGDKLARTDDDYAVSWCRDYGQGKVFYTSLGHQQKVWNDPAYQKHLVGGLKWAMGELPGDATPSGAKK